MAAKTPLIRLLKLLTVWSPNLIRLSTLKLTSHQILGILRLLSILSINIAQLSRLGVVETGTIELLLSRRLALRGHISHLMNLMLIVIL